MRTKILGMCGIIGLMVAPITALLAAAIVGNELIGFNEMGTYFISFAVMTVAILFKTQIVKFITKRYYKNGKVTSWFVAVGLSVIGYWLEIGTLKGMSIIWVVVYGITAGMVANWIYKIKAVKYILNVIKLNRKSN